MRRRPFARLARALADDASVLRRTLPIAVAYGIVLASLYVLKPARNALFLSGPGAGQLPYALLLVALAGGLTAATVSRVANVVRVKRLIALGFPLVAVTLGGFWTQVGRNTSWSPYALYVWVSVCGHVTTSLVWLLANAAFDAREARRAFAYLGAAGIAGAIAGGWFTQRAAGALGTENLLLVGAALILGCLPLVARVRTFEGGRETARRRRAPTGALAALRHSTLLRTLAATVGLTAIVSTVADVQFNAIVARTFPSVDAKTAFFGAFFASLNAAALLFQLLVTPRLLARLGLGPALLVLPLGLALGSAAVLAVPTLATALLLKGVDGGLRHSLNRSVIEILFVPVPPAVKRKAKVLLDATVDNLGTGVAALLVLLATHRLGVEFRYLSVVSLGAVAAWVALAVRGRNAYVNAFREALFKREIDPHGLHVDVSDASSRRALVSALGGDNERQLVYALDMIGSIQDPTLITPLRRLVDHRSAEVRARAVRALAAQRDAPSLPRIAARLDDVHDVRTAAVTFLCLHAPDPLEELARLLHDPKPLLRAAALGSIAEHFGREARALLAPDLVRAVLEQRDAAGELQRLELARALGQLRDPTLRDPLIALMRDPAPGVAAAAIAGIGRLADPTLVPWLVAQLGERRFRLAARRALAALGPAALGVLGRQLADPGTPPSVRRNLPAVLALIADQRAADVLVAQLGRADPALRHRLVKALNTLHLAHPLLRLDPSALHYVLVDELRWYGELVQALAARRGDVDGPAGRLLSRALAEKQGETLERIFRLLGLSHPPRDIYNAYLGLVSGHRLARAHALEFLDNVLAPRTRHYLLPLVESESVAAAAAAGAALFGPLVADGGLLPHLARSRDPWLRACAIHGLPQPLSADVRELVMAARHDPDPAVSEAAARTLAG